MILNVILLFLPGGLSHCSQGPGIPEGWYYLLLGPWRLVLSTRKSLSDSAFLMPFATCSPAPFSIRSPFPLVLLLLLIYLQKTLSSDLTLGGLWLSYLHMQKVSLYSSRVTCPFFHLYCRPFSPFASFPAHWDGLFLNLEEVILKRISRSSLVSGIITHRILPRMSLNRPEALP